MSTGGKLAAAAAVGVLLAASGHGHHHLSIPSLDSFAAAPISGTPAHNAALGRRMAAARGWTGGQWRCLDWLWTRESGWSQYADTRQSGLDPAGASVFAYGIPQSRPATKMPHSAWPADLGGQSGRRAQIRWGLGYIAATYGSPCSAWAHETAHNWY